MGILLDPPASLAAAGLVGGTPFAERRETLCLVGPMGGSPAAAALARFAGTPAPLHRLWAVMGPSRDGGPEVPYAFVLAPLAWDAARVHTLEPDAWIFWSGSPERQTRSAVYRMQCLPAAQWSVDSGGAVWIRHPLPPSGGGAPPRPAGARLSRHP